MNPQIPHQPRLRRVSIRPAIHEGDEIFLFHDESGIAPDAQLPRQWGPLLALMDGTNDIDAILRHIDGGDHAVLRSWLEKLISDLDEMYYLDSPRFRARQSEVESGFLGSNVRGAAFAGPSYPAQPDRLRAFLNEKLGQGRARLSPATYNAENVRGIVTPHIDFHRGGHTEAASYWPLLENVRQTEKPFDMLIVFGIAHSGIDYPFCLTQKSFATPLGLAELDADFSRDLLEQIGPSLIQEEIAHKNEHSIEFSAVFCQFFEELRPSKIVPILCGGFFESLRSEALPEIADPEVGDFIQALRRVTEKHAKAGKKIGFIASVDGAHVGTQFGDKTQITPQKLQEIEREDRKWCASIEAGDKIALHRHFSKNQNVFNVDAHPALYTLMAAFPSLRGQLLDYDQAFNANANIVVSFASLALFQDSPI